MGVEQIDYNLSILRARERFSVAVWDRISAGRAVSGPLTLVSASCCVRDALGDAATTELKLSSLPVYTSSHRHMIKMPQGLRAFLSTLIQFRRGRPASVQVPISVCMTVA